MKKQYSEILLEIVEKMDDVLMVSVTQDNYVDDDLYEGEQSL